MIFDERIHCNRPDNSIGPNRSRLLDILTHGNRLSMNMLSLLNIDIHGIFKLGSFSSCSHASSRWWWRWWWLIIRITSSFIQSTLIRISCSGTLVLNWFTISFITIEYTLTFILHGTCCTKITFNTSILTRWNNLSNKEFWKDVSYLVQIDNQLTIDYRTIPYYCCQMLINLSVEYLRYIRIFNEKYLTKVIVRKKS